MSDTPSRSFSGVEGPTELPDLHFQQSECPHGKPTARECLTCMYRELQLAAVTERALAQDRARLDFLSRPRPNVTFGVNRHGLIPGATLYVFDDATPADGKTLRDAIDLAMQWDEQDSRAARSVPAHPLTER
jgi:hypothetical protein